MGYTLVHFSFRRVQSKRDHSMNLRGGPNGRLVLFERSQELKKQKKQYTTFLYSVVQSSAVLFKVSKNRHGESSVNNKLLKSLERPVGRRLPT